MAEVSPLRGIRYAEPQLDSLLSPPYDVISPEQWQTFVNADPHNVLRIEHPTGDPQVPANDAGGAYQSAAATLEAWLRSGVLLEDDQPAIYVVEHEFPDPWGSGSARRTGILALIPALPWEAGVIKPHERTFAGPKQDRLALLRATHTQASPIFGVWTNGRTAELALHDITQEQQPVQAATFEGDLGAETISLWRVDAVAHLNSLLQGLDSAQLYIADGHHRYETAVAFASELTPPGAKANPRVMTYLSSATDTGLYLLPTHRLITGMAVTLTEPDLRAKLGGSWTVEETHQPVVAEASPPPLNVLTLATPQTTFRLSRPRRRSSPRARLDVSVLHDEVLPALGISGSQEGLITYQRDPNQALTAVRQGQAALAFLLPPPSVTEMIEVADAGEFMPQKSTYFYPKVPTGLALWHVLA